VPFEPRNEPPETTDGAARADAAPDRWYVVRAGELWTAGGPGRVPVGAAPLDVATAAVDVAPLAVGVLDGATCWAVGVAADGSTGLPGGSDDGRWEPLMALASTVGVEEWTAAGRAVQLVEWARTSRFCGRCGTATVQAPGERAMRCPACRLLAYPRLAPAVIVLIRREGEALLARNRRFRGDMFSTVAGFVEPGETLEEAVHREVAEEVGVRLGEVRYVASQPWPFPHSLMCGFEADWVSGDIAVDGDEIVEAAWFAPDALPTVPPQQSIARRLIDGWLADVG
jgi:NAD+ diphosphatase